MLKHIPNILTITRFFLIPIIVVSIIERKLYFSIYNFNSFWINRYFRWVYCKKV